MPVKPGYLILAGAGAIFLWSGLQGKSATGVARALIGGQDPGSAANANQIIPTSNSAVTGTLGSGTSGSFAGPSTGGGNASANQALAKMIAIAMGHPDWTVGQQWADWVKLWNQESGWNQFAANPSGAYGIPQSLPASKMAAAGSDYRTNPATQIKWGVGYIAGRYGSPSAAWAHEVANNWY